MKKLISERIMLKGKNIANGGMAEGKEEEEVKKKLNNCEEGENDEQSKHRNSRSINYACLLKYLSLLVLVLQNTSQVLMMRYATTRDANQYPSFLKTVAVFFNEVVKFFAALTLFFISTGNFFRSISILKHHFITNFLDILKVGVPAFIYLIQNFLLYVAVENLDAGTYMVTYQLKILTTAMFTVLMLKRKLSIQQWIALLILIAGIATVQISAQKRKTPSSPSLPYSNYSITNFSSSSSPEALPIQASSQNEQSPLLGFVTIIVACFLSGFAGIYFEKILKGSDVSVWLRNTQLAALSIPVGLIVIFFKDRQRVMEDGFMQGFDFVVWSVVLLQALGGLVVAVVIKYADNILKAFATSVSIVVATIASIFIFAIFPALLFIGGAVLVIGAVVLYGVFPYKKRTLKAKEEEEAKGEEMEKIIVKGKGHHQNDEEEGGGNEENDDKKCKTLAGNEMK